MPTSVTTESQQVQIKIDGSNLAAQTMDVLESAEVETSMYLPSMFTLRFHDEKLTLLDGSLFTAGKAVEIFLPNPSNVLTSVFKGEITAIEPEFSEQFETTLVVRGYDKGHRLNRGTKNKVFVNVTDGDIVSQIAQANGLQAQSDTTSIVHPHVFQYAVSDWVFLHERARRNGFEVLVVDNKLLFRKISTTTDGPALEWGTTLWSFHPRMSLARQINKVTVKGWDPKTKQALVGVAQTSSSSPSTGFTGWGGQLAQSKFSAAEAMEVQHPVRTQNEATLMAQSILDEVNAGFLEADGVAFGNPGIKPGTKVAISKVGAKFNGNYVVTSARHTFRIGDPYITEFTVQGARAKTMADLVDTAMSEQRAKQLWGGVVVGLVTNNNDPDSMGRIKVKFPWLDDTLESNWIRVSAPSAGNGRGIMWLPEVNDEVLVAFEHGDFDYPYMVGAVWNGRDKPPDAASTAVKNGKVEVRTMKSRLGHTIKMTDGDSVKKIEIIGSAGDTITFDESTKKITIESKGDIEIKAATNLNLTATNVKIEASGQLEVKSSGMGKVEAGGVLTVKGSLVNIN